MSYWLVLNHNYYDKPEGEAPFEKMFATGKWGFLAGMFCAIPDIIGHSKVTTPGRIINCAAFWVVPLTSMGVSFATVTYVAHNIRKKDDKINYILGALASTSILHKWGKNFTLTCYGAVAMVAAACIKKEAIERKFRFFPQYAIKREVIDRSGYTRRSDPRYM